MGDEVTCPVCGRERTAWVPEKTLGAFVVPWAEAAKCWHGNDGADDREHWRIGYERSQAALAAARRECEELRTRVTRILCIGCGRDQAVAHNQTITTHTLHFKRCPGSGVDIARAALAAPAAGEEGKR